MADQLINENTVFWVMIEQRLIDPDGTPLVLPVFHKSTCYHVTGQGRCNCNPHVTVPMAALPRKN